ncbi:hypothetical protein ACFZDG_22470 [Kitasatospora xanthocidica]|uniref:hypothetical protein n=1 Tax=Kitasatospora xanthocidica TaxID=83382 RepID=UPI0036E370ED
MAIPALDHSTTRYSLPHAHWMAQAAALASLDRAGIEEKAHAWGFDEVRHFESTHRMPFPIEDTQAYTMASDRMIVTGFRGTEVLKIYDWLTDVSTPPVPGPANIRDDDLTVHITDDDPIRLYRAFVTVVSLTRGIAE